MSELKELQLSTRHFNLRQDNDNKLLTKIYSQIGLPVEERVIRCEKLPDVIAPTNEALLDLISFMVDSTNVRIRKINERLEKLGIKND